MEDFRDLYGSNTNIQFPPIDWDSEDDFVPTVQTSKRKRKRALLKSSTSLPPESMDIDQDKLKSSLDNGEAKDTIERNSGSHSHITAREESKNSRSRCPNVTAIKAAKPTVNVSDPAYLRPFLFGWKREIVCRTTSGKSNQCKRDVYYITPTGIKLRSLRDIEKTLTNEELTLRNFTLFKGTLGLDDPTKEIMRNAKCTALSTPSATTTTVTSPQIIGTPGSPSKMEDFSDLYGSNTNDFVPTVQTSKRKRKRALLKSSTSLPPESMDIDQDKLKSSLDNGEAKDTIERNSGSHLHITAREESKNSRLSSPNVTAIKAAQPTVNVSDPAYLRPFLFGWKREIVCRTTSGKSNRDVYYHTPTGKKLRSLREIAITLTNKELTLRNFTLFKGPLGLDDPTKEIIRNSKGTDSSTPSPTTTTIASHQISTKGVTYKCGICGRDFREATKLRRHIIYTHSKKQAYQCKRCKKSFKFNSQLNEHRRNCKQNQNVCPECGKEYSNKCGLNRHIKAKHSDGTFPCDQCTKVFHRLDTLKRHLIGIHSTNPAYQCNHCEKRFKYRNYFIIHVRTCKLNKRQSNVIEAVEASNLDESNSTVKSDDSTDILNAVINNFLENNNTPTPPDSPANDSDSDILNISVKSTGTLSTCSEDNLNEKEQEIRDAINRMTTDESLLYTDLPIRNDTKNEIKQRNYAIMKKIFDQFKAIELALQNNQQVGFVVRRRRRWENCQYKNGQFQLKDNANAETTLINYYSLSQQPSYLLLIHLLYRIFVLLKENRICTQRTIFYKWRHSIKTLKLEHQSQVALAMNILTSMLSVPPWHLPIYPESKGLCYGDLTITTSALETIQYNGTRIPPCIYGIRKITTRASFILLVEKDTVFKQLLTDGVVTNFTKPFIIVTAKGMPDISTRLFLKRLWMSLRVPVLILTDGDVGGMEIMLNYRFGSLEMAHLADELAIPKMKWLGILSSDVNTFKIKTTPLNKNDRNKLKVMLKRPYINANQWLKNEIHKRLEQNWKTTLEDFILNDQFQITNYLNYKLSRQDYV